MKILIAEDDAELARQLTAELTADGHSLKVEKEGKGALKTALGFDWDVAILDVTLPGPGGFEIVQAIRDRGIDNPVIFLTAKSDVSDRVTGLSLGGDDYLTKPFSMDELKARLHALCRRFDRSKQLAPAPPEGWELDPLLRQVTIFGRSINLQPREWSLLKLFLQHEGEVLTNTYLLDRVWDIRFDPGTNVVDAAVCRLRKKLDAPGQDSFVETVRGRGHIFRRHV
ncbi:MAG: response regulator transcription factor [Verrucomicrobiae bacterium]|nr:response regulator transcription factor [Verrucomicrobiae bacterium]MCB1085832.1 response regulator transcription factor [Verrucomicrobiae bacterium]